MSLDQILISAILVGVLTLFISNVVRYDLAALIALMAAVLLGLVPDNSAFAGFGHPATITVAAVLVISRALANSGAVDIVVRSISGLLERPSVHIGALGGIGAVLSAMMNNVGALALLLPSAIQSADKAKRSPALILMPLSFATILGGMLTLIGTPPNIIVAAYREEIMDAPFRMFDFTPVGAIIAAIGLVYVALIGWRLLPKPTLKRNTPNELFDLEDYVTEARIPKDSDVIGKSVAEIEDETNKYDIIIGGLIRAKRRFLGQIRSRRLRAGDILIIEANPQEMDKFVSSLGLDFVGIEEAKGSLLRSDDVSVVEAVVTPKARIEGRVAGDLRLRSRYGVNLLAVSRQGRPLRDRLRSFRFRAGDVLLLQGASDQIQDVMSTLGCLPLAGRGWQVGKRHQAGIAVAIFAAAIAAATFDLATMPTALGTAALLMVILNIVPAREVYDAIDWPVIVLLGAMIPVAAALETTGTTQLLANAVIAGSGVLPAWSIILLLLVVTMTLSDIMNNAATAVVMTPIAAGIAGALDVSADPFLMAVAVGASCAFLTPIGHQNNTLVMGPGGYAFGDYWRMGLPLELIIAAVGVPAILWVWPL